MHAEIGKYEEQQMRAIELLSEADAKLQAYAWLGDSKYCAHVPRESPT